MQPGRIATAAIGLSGLFVAVLCAFGTVLVVCGGLWFVFWPVNYLGCGTERPAGITTTDLVGSYLADDGGWLELHPDGTLTARGLDDSGDPVTGRPLSGPGTWTLRPEGDLIGDVELSFQSPSGYHYGPSLLISGSREDPWLYWYLGDPDACQLYRLDRLDRA